ncbi:4Fe-4S double cluster binding domain-containing protein [Caloramator sp. mosi_1]|nr:4Fe-4S double cluster binding domain-containing protein [Caloramator sp. mosi_1]WDC84590.1 4Fe-4S double cluster binding domain-containing protein [Caloramator sp. mosi_1]
MGEILTNIDIEPSTPKASLCGSCDKCIKACPVGAIKEEYFVDANKCLSYISQKGMNYLNKIKKN